MKTKFSLTTATALVVANMVGSGVFTSLGFQAAGSGFDAVEFSQYFFIRFLREK